MPIAPREHTPTEDAHPPFCAGRKLSDLDKALLWKLRHEDPACPPRALLDQVAHMQRALAVSVRHLHWLRATQQRNRRQGRPRHVACSTAAGGALVQVTPHLAYVGVQLFAHGLDQQEAFEPGVARLQQAIAAHKSAHPADNLALWPHRDQTLRRRFAALLLAPLLGLAPLTAFDTHEQPLQTLLGRGSHSTTLRPFLGQLERLEAAAARLPALVPDKTSPITQVDGPMLAYGRRASMHQGKLTLLGRMMAGSHAVSAHDATGHAVGVEYHPPDLPWSQVMVAEGQKGALATGSALCVIDRAVHSWAMAGAFAPQGWGLRCMLDDHEHDGLASLAATEVATLADGPRVQSGPWHEARPADPRDVVSVEPATGKPLVSWGTPQVKDTGEVTQWPRVSRERNARQDHSVKRMSDHGARHPHYGRKKSVGPDRHQQRAREKLAQAVQAAQQRLGTQAEALKGQPDKGAESVSQGHGTRLEQRQRAWVSLAQEVQDTQDTHDQRVAQAQALGPPRQRADREFRKQTSMTVRPLLLENALTSFMAVLVGSLTMKVSLDGLWHILCARSGTRMVTGSQMLYWMNTTGLSAAYQRLLTAVVDGLCTMDLRAQGKPIHVRLTGLSP